MIALTRVLCHNDEESERNTCSSRTTFNGRNGALYIAGHPVYKSQHHDRLPLLQLGKQAREKRARERARDSPMLHKRNDRDVGVGNGSPPCDIFLTKPSSHNTNSLPYGHRLNIHATTKVHRALQRSRTTTKSNDATLIDETKKTEQLNTGTCKNYKSHWCLIRCRSIICRSFCTLKYTSASGNPKCSCPKNVLTKSAAARDHD